MALAEFELKDIGGIFTSIREALTGEKIKDPLKVMQLLNKAEGLLIEAKGSIITAEAKSEHWIVSAWRPITMLVFVFIIFNNYVLVPYFNILFGIEIPYLELTQNMWDMLKIGLGGYIVGRSGEKIAKNWKGTQ